MTHVWSFEIVSNDASSWNDPPQTSTSTWILDFQDV